MAGKAVGLITDAITKKYQQSKGHKIGKKLQHLFEGFDAKDKKWIDLFTDTFFNIFVNYNVVFCKVIEQPVDAWTKIMGKLAKDIVHRMFNHLIEMKDNDINKQKITKELLIKASVGTSDPKFN